MKMMSNFKFSPRELTYNVENESKMHKARILGGAFALAIIAGSMQAYYDDLAFRATQAQIHFLEGDDKYDNIEDNTVFEWMKAEQGEDLWYLRNNLDIHNSKSIKELKFAEEGWAYQEVQRDEGGLEDKFENIAGTTILSQKIQYFRTANGDIQSDKVDNLPNDGWFTQQQGQPMDIFDAQFELERKFSTRQGERDFYEARYSDWESFTDGIVWFDSLGCMEATSGGINDILFQGQDDRDCFRSTTPVLTAAQQQAALLTQQAADAAALLAAQQAAANQPQVTVPVVTVPVVPQLTAEQIAAQLAAQQQADLLAQQAAAAAATLAAQEAAQNAIAEEARRAAELVAAQNRLANIQEVGPANVRVSRDTPETELTREQWNERGNDYEVRGFWTTGRKGDCQVASVQTTTQTNEGYVFTPDRTTDIRRSDGSIKVFDEDAQKDFLEEYLDLIEDCDIDCQRNGSGMSMVAFLNGLVLGLIGLNALFMFFGIWMTKFRIVSIYMNFATCLFHFVVIIVSATCLFNQFATTLCARSLTLTGEGRLYTMADDYRMNVGLWVFQLFCLFGFMCCGLCGAYRSEGSGVVMMNSFTSK